MIAWRCLAAIFEADSDQGPEFRGISNRRARQSQKQIESEESESGFRVRGNAYSHWELFDLIASDI